MTVVQLNKRGLVVDVDEVRQRLCLVAERKIQAILLGLEEELIETGGRIADVTVDTRNFAQMRPSIFTNDRAPA